MAISRISEKDRRLSSLSSTDHTDITINGLDGFEPLLDPLLVQGRNGVPSDKVCV